MHIGTGAACCGIKLTWQVSLMFTAVTSVTMCIGKSKVGSIDSLDMTHTDILTDISFTSMGLEEALQNST